MKFIFGKKIKISLILLAIFTIVGALFLREIMITAVPRGVSSCNKEDKKLRFSCYRSVIERNFRGGLEDYLSDIGKRKDLDFSVSAGSDVYAIFGTNCHTFYHALGDFAASYGSADDLEMLLRQNPAKCTGGYTMGLYKRLALKEEFSRDFLKKLLEYCPVNESVQCAHEVGHLLHDKHALPILTKLDGLTSSNYGIKEPEVVRKYFGEGVEDMKAAFEECDELIEDEILRAQCRTGIGHNIFLFSEFSPEGVIGEINGCRAITDQKTRDDCVSFLVYRVGINEASVKFMTGDFEGGTRSCKDVVDISGEPDLERHCYIGLGGGIGLFADSEYALTEINDKNIAVIKSRMNDLMNLCERAPNEFKENCYAGLFGTRFSKFYDLLKLYNERVEKLRPVWTIFEVVG